MKAAYYGVIKESKDMNPNCRGYALPSLCYSVLPICRTPEMTNHQYFLHRAIELEKERVKLLELQKTSTTTTTTTTSTTLTTTTEKSSTEGPISSLSTIALNTIVAANVEPLATIESNMSNSTIIFNTNSTNSINITEVPNLSTSTLSTSIDRPKPKKQQKSREKKNRKHNNNNNSNQQQQSQNVQIDDTIRSSAPKRTRRHFNTKNLIEDTQNSLKSIHKSIMNAMSMPLSTDYLRITETIQYQYPPTRSSENLRRICRKECELLENELCQKEYAIAKRHPAIGGMLPLEDCHNLPEQKESGGKDECSTLGIAIDVDETEECYWENGSKYRGIIAVSQSGKPCLTWARLMKEIADYPELAGQNYCR